MSRPPIWLLAAVFLLPMAFQGCPGPAPGPGPVPPPAPITGKLWVIVVDETANRTPGQARILGDLSFLRSLDCPWRILDKDDPSVVSNKYLDLVTKAGGTPALLLIDEAGACKKAVKLPETEEAITSLVKEVKG